MSKQILRIRVVFFAMVTLVLTEIARMSTEFSLPIIDGIACATVFAEALAATGLKTSKTDGYAAPVR